MINSVTNVSNYNDDDFDDPFAPSDDSNINVLAHDDWNGLPWTEEPTDETASATDDDEEDDWAFLTQTIVHLKRCQSQKCQTSPQRKRKFARN